MRKVDFTRLALINIERDKELHQQLTDEAVTPAGLYPNSFGDKIRRIVLRKLDSESSSDSAWVQDILFFFVRDVDWTEVAQQIIDDANG